MNDSIDGKNLATNEKNLVKVSVVLFFKTAHATE